MQTEISIIHAEIDFKNLQQPLKYFSRHYNRFTSSLVLFSLHFILFRCM